ncbi:MAG: hypothetical protein CALGDGBN_00817 [Pseudomonadales bacterium]|nr:hypothetical protein [Pseudomonadales bacterium]
MSSRCVERRPRTHQRGVALVLVLLVFALATLMAGRMLRAGQLALQRSADLADTVQARYYALGGEELARVLLREDVRTGGDRAAVDHLRESWAGGTRRFEIDDGLLEIEITDESALFNLNGLLDARGVVDPAGVRRFARLLRAGGADPAFASVVADWIDADRLTASGSPEPADPPALDRPFTDASELRAVPGFDPAWWEALGGLLGTLPPATPLNLNTAPPAVLVAWAEPGRETALASLIARRERTPLRSVAEAGAVFGAAPGRLAVGSEFFRVHSHAAFRERHVRVEALLRRDAAKGTIVLLARNDAARL